MPAALRPTFLLLAIGLLSVLYLGLPRARPHGLLVSLGVRPPPPGPLAHARPTARFRDNLRNDTQYITTFAGSGYTNDVYSLINLLFLALTTGRTALVPAFMPSHVGAAAGPLRAGDVFDLPALAAYLRIPIVEWHDVKVLGGPNGSMPVEPLGCWSTRDAIFAPDGGVPYTPAPASLGLDVSFWPLDVPFRLGHAPPAPPQVNLLALGALGLPDWREKGMVRMPRRPARAPGGSFRAPELHVLCVDYLFFAGTWSQEYLEMYEQFSPAWELVGRHMRFAPPLQELARQMAHRALGVPESAPTPPFVAVHIRHGDFSGWCPDGMSPADCFAPLDAYAVKVREVQAELAAQGVAAPRVLVASDERNAKFWADVRGRGWAAIDHDAEGTAAAHGAWYPVLVDQAAQALAAGFVRTDRSTYSLIGERRVRSWRAVSASRMVKWGAPGADATA